MSHADPGPSGDSCNARTSGADFSWLTVGDTGIMEEGRLGLFPLGSDIVCGGGRMYGTSGR